MNYINLFESNPLSNIIYLDSSCLLRDYSIHILSKCLTRNKYIKNEQKFTKALNCLAQPLLDKSITICTLLTELLNKNVKIITLDCMLPLSSTPNILPIFGTLSYNNHTFGMNNSVILYGDKISVETFFNASTLIRSADIIIIDDHFKILPLGNQLLNRKKEGSKLYTLSTIIGFSSFRTDNVIDVLSFLH